MYILLKPFLFLIQLMLVLFLILLILILIKTTTTFDITTTTTTTTAATNNTATTSTYIPITTINTIITCTILLPKLSLQLLQSTTLCLLMIHHYTKQLQQLILHISTITTYVNCWYH